MPRVIATATTDIALESGGRRIAGRVYGRGRVRGDDPDDWLDLPPGSRGERPEVPGSQALEAIGRFGGEVLVLGPSTTRSSPPRRSERTSQPVRTCATRCSPGPGTASPSLSGRPRSCAGC